MNSINLITIFDKPYSQEKLAEGLAISTAIMSGACDRCEYLRVCESSGVSAFPSDAWCMKKKAELLKEVTQ